MTYLEKARELRPDFTVDRQIFRLCPDYFGIVGQDCSIETCEECWNREIPVEVTNEL